MENNFIKITNAVYNLLDFFPDSDPLKNKAKEKALAILESLTLISGAQGWVSLQKEKSAAQLLDDIEVLESYLKLGKYQGWIDDINLLIIIKEYNKIKGEVPPPKGAIRKNLEIISNVKRDSALVVDKEPVGAQNIAGGENYSERQKKILQILSQNEKAQVADIIKELPNITKRTIRRDLDDLLKKGKVVRVGEWNQVFYKILRGGIQHQQYGGIKNVKMASISMVHSIDDLAQLFEYKEGTFANNYNPRLAEKIRSINLPEKVISIEQLESIIKDNLTPEERSLVSKHLAERMDELRNNSHNYKLFDRTSNLS